LKKGGCVGTKRKNKIQMQQRATAIAVALCCEFLKFIKYVFLFQRATPMGGTSGRIGTAIKQ
jgi:hypothetical protein